MFMKSKLFMLAAAAAALASCSSDEVVSENTGDAISFRTAVSGQTRAVEMTTSNLGAFNVYAMKSGTSTPYFEDVLFHQQADNSFASSTKYYWPNNQSLDFFAYAKGSDNQVTKGGYNTFSVSPSTTVPNQVDFIYAATKGRTKANSKNGVELNFRHAESKISLKVKNTSGTMTFDVYGWKVGYVSTGGTFTFDPNSKTDSHNDGTNSNLIPLSAWNAQPATVSGSYENTLSDTKYVGVNSAEASVGTDMILVPQVLSGFNNYQTANLGDKLNGAYIGVKLIIRNNDDVNNQLKGTVIVGGGQNNDEGVWAVWPLTDTWEPGKHYTYVIDLKDGGYYEEQEDPDDPSTNPDPLLKNAEIKFVSVQVDEWVNVTPDTQVPFAY